MAEKSEVARALGWFSIGLGLFEFAAPGVLEKALGMKDRTTLIRFYGLREILAGIGLLANTDGPGKPAAWVWGRAAGDALDFATLLSAYSPDNPKRDNVALALAIAGGFGVLDAVVAQQLSVKEQKTEGASADPGRVERSMTIGKPAAELYRLWRDPQVQRQIMTDLAEVTMFGGGSVAHWRVNAPMGKTIEWDAQTVEEKPDESVRWQSVTGSPVPVEGGFFLKPAPDDRGTVATLRFHFDPPGGAAGNAVAKLLHAIPDVAVSRALRRFKALAETGEIPTIKPQPAARPGND